MSALARFADSSRTSREVGEVPAVDVGIIRSAPFDRIVQVLLRGDYYDAVALQEVMRRHQLLQRRLAQVDAETQCGSAAAGLL
jgi:hypothetical protein